MSTFDCFLQIDGISGDSYDSRHPDEIDILSFRWGESQTAAAHSGGGGGIGKVNVTDLLVVARTSKASPRLMVACASGRHLTSARLTCSHPGEEVAPAFLTIALSNVLVSGYQVSGDSGSGGSLPTDEIALNFGSIRIEYRAQRPDGSLENPVTGEWNVLKNRGT